MEAQENINEIEEVFKTIPFASDYAVSNFGNVISNKCKKKRYLKQSIAKGYCRVKLHLANGFFKNYSVHRLVAMCFIPNPQCKKQVNHINGIKTDNRVENLEWATNQENCLHGFDVLHRERRKEVHQYSLEGRYLAPYRSARYAGEALGIEKVGIAQCCEGKLISFGGYMWSYLKKDHIEPYKNPRHKQCVVFDKYGRIIGKFKTVSEAAKKYNIDPRNAGRSCRAKWIKGSISCGDYVFRFFNKDEINSIISQTKTPIEKFTRKGVFIKQYSSCIEASIETNIPFQYILKNCNNFSQSCFNSIFRFTNHQKQ